MSLPTTDVRYSAARHGDLVYPFPVYETLAAWETRATWLREHILITLGLWPLPERTPLHAQVCDTIEYDDYSVAKVYFESWPDFYCTGNLYRPRGLGQRGPCPAILNPHGHWEQGRLVHTPLGSVRARCVTLARLGMVAFSHDMVGYNDSCQVPLHRWATRRGALWGISPMALQTWNSIRALDFLASLPEVDATRLGCTGESGGGTQTFLLTAVDERVRVAVPVNMISAHFQGGCVCENAPGLRTQTTNVEIAALAAPRPLLMVSASGDWTVNTPTVEYPAVRSVYQLYGAEAHLAWAQVDAPHNYNAASREHAYRWFARWFLGDESLGQGAEREFAIEPEERLRVFAGAALPAGALRGAELEQALVKQAQARLEALFPHTPEDLARLRVVTARRLEHILEGTPPAPEVVYAEEGLVSVHEEGQECPLVLGRVGRGDRVVGTLYLPPQPPRGVALVVHGAGQAGNVDAFGAPGALLRALRGAGYAALSLDALWCGGVPASATARRDGDWFWDTFNAPLLGARVQDILTALAYLAGRFAGLPVTAIGLAEAGPWALLAAALGPAASLVAVEMGALRAADEAAYLSRLYAPPLCSYGGMAVVSALVAPRPLLLADTGGHGELRWAKAAYVALGAGANLHETLHPLDAAHVLPWLPHAEVSSSQASWA